MSEVGRAPAPCLVVATSGRLLAEAVAAAGHPVDVCDAFGDADARRVAQHCTVLPWSARHDPAPLASAVLAAVRSWAAAHPGGVLVAGAGFEHRPDLLADCAALLPLAGTPPAALADCKDPYRLQAACAAAGLSTPPLCPPGASDPADWLSRERGGCGGGHIRDAARDTSGHGRIWQRRTAGDPVSLLFHADTSTCTPLSWQRQYCAPAPDAPYRFGGVVRTDPCTLPWSDALAQAASALAGRFGLRGLNGIDALWDDGRLWILEINPRPPASLALLSDAARAHWMGVHLADATDRAATVDAATRDRRPRIRDLAASRQDLAEHALNAGAAVVYASTRLSIPADFRFPPGCHDLPRLPHTFEAGEPVCSVHVCTGGIGKLRTLIGILRERLLPVAGADALSSL